jgi:selenocysteine lyase/cysteine desulfurase
MEWNHIVELFPITNDCIYLNNAGLAPLPTLAKTAMVGAIDEALTRTFTQAEWQSTYDRTRSKVAELIHCEPIEVAFVRSTSEGLSAILNGITWTADDNIVTYTHEHPSIRFNCLRLSLEYGVELKVAGEQGGLPDTDHLISLIDDHTKAVLISWVQYGSGFRSPLRTIGLHCRQRRALFIVDVVQGVGALALDVRQECIDACSAGAHKFLLGPEGIGFMFVARSALDRVRPSVVGWRSVKGYNDLELRDFTYNDGSLRFEYGTLNRVGVSGLEASIDLLLSLRPKTVEDYLMRLSSHLTQGLEAKQYLVSVSPDAKHRSAIVSCAHKKRSAGDLEQHLRSRRIETSSRAGRLRISPHVYNTLDDINDLLRVLSE